MWGKALFSVLREWLTKTLQRNSSPREPRSSVVVVVLAHSSHMLLLHMPTRDRGHLHDHSVWNQSTNLCTQRLMLCVMATAMCSALSGENLPCRRHLGSNVLSCSWGPRVFLPCNRACPWEDGPCHCPFLGPFMLHRVMSGAFSAVNANFNY